MIAETLLAAAIAFFGGSIEECWTNAPTAARFYPVAASVAAMVAPDGGKMVFNAGDGGTFAGPVPWVARRQGGRVDVWTDPRHCGGAVRTAFTFIGGQLRGISADGREFRFPAGTPATDGRALAGLFPPERRRETARGSAGDIWRNDGARWRLWFVNPNDAGLCAALAALALAWGAFACRRRTTVCLCAALAAAAVFTMAKTASRGALLALLCGGLALMATVLRRGFSRRAFAVVAIGAAALAVGLVAGGGVSRLAGAFVQPDAGNRLRIKIARAATEMIADAPGGWRGGETPARSAALNWYVADERHIIRTHLVTVAELGWLRGAGYWAGWAFVLAFGALAWRRGHPLVLALWVAFFAAGWFNPVYRRWEVWTIPAAAWVWTAWVFARTGDLKRTLKRSAAVAAIAAPLAMAAPIAVGRLLERRAPVPVRSAGAAALVNGERPDIWIVEDGAVLGGGGFPGREIMLHYRRHPDAPAVGYVQSLADLPPQAATLVLPGRRAAEYLQLAQSGDLPCRARRIIFLSPSVGPAAVPDSLAAAAQTVWFAGVLAARYSPDYAQHRPWVRFFPGCELYIPGWVELVFANCFKTETGYSTERNQQ